LARSRTKTATIERARKLIEQAVSSQPSRSMTPDAAPASAAAADKPAHPCPCCGGRMVIIETFERGCEPRHRPSPAPALIRIDTS
jgi:hypothetical protein